MARYTSTKQRLCAVLLGIISLSGTGLAQKLSWSEQIPIESFKGMREVERYQMKVAEKHYLKGEYKIALDEYEKFLGLYETSSGAAYSQLMWSHCLVKLRKVNTAIRDGFQSVIDYWPQSEEAVMASFLIAKSYQAIGETAKATAAYRQLMEAYPDGQTTILAKMNLLEIAKTAQENDTVLDLLEELTFETTRNENSKGHCEIASRELALFYFRAGDFANATKALGTTYSKGSNLDHYISEYGRPAIQHLNRADETKDKATKLADQMIAHFEKSIPADVSEDPAKKVARDSLNRIAATYGSVGKKENVRTTYERIGKLLGSDDALLGQIAGYHRGNGERDKAREIYSKYENQIAGKGAIAGMLREEGKLDEAIAVYRELIDADTSRLNDYLWAIAECYEGKKEWKNAIQTYRQIDRFPTNYFRMASCHRRLKEWKEALSLLAQCKSDERHSPEAMIQIALTYEQAGQRENAIKAFQLTCRTHPKSSQASRAHAHLQSKYDITVTLGGAKDD